MIADVAFDAPLPTPYTYRVPDGVALVPGQRVRAILRDASRVGIVVGVRDGDASGLKPLGDVVDATPVVTPEGLELIRWIAGESLSSIGSTAASLLPPPIETRAPGDDHRYGVAATAAGPRPELLTGAGRERKVLDRIAALDGPVLVLTSDVETSARWAQRLGKIGPVARLDSDVADADRASAWRALETGRMRLGVGTRGALLAPVASFPTLVLIDEHEEQHRPPGHPRLHARDIVFERARREKLALWLTSATPSVETWWRTTVGLVRTDRGERGAWPNVVIADTRGILRREPLTPELSRALRETLSRGGRAFIAVSRLTASLACDECGLIVRCEMCGVALAYSRAAATLGCRVCGASVALMDRCPGCSGRRLSPFGWSPERVEHAVRRRFSAARIARYDPALRGARRSASHAAASAADVVIGTPAALKLFGPGALGMVGFVSPDQWLRLPDFRASERLLDAAWAAAERIRPGGTLIVQSQHPAHHALAAIAAQDLATFYDRELAFRAELGYPPFRRLAVLTVRQRSGAPPRLVDEVAAAVRGAGRLVAYPPTSARRERAHRIVVKGEEDLPSVLSEVMRGLNAARFISRGIIDVEVDPVEWQF